MVPVDVFSQAVLILVEPLLAFDVNFFDRSVAAECHSDCMARWSSTSLQIVEQRLDT